jgi:hypothetical protein
VIIPKSLGDFEHGNLVLSEAPTPGEGWSWSPLQWSRSAPTQYITNALTTTGSVAWLHFAFANKRRRNRGKVAAKLANHLSPTMAPNGFDYPIKPMTLANMRERLTIGIAPLNVEIGEAALLALSR